jgi:uncharacterized membrane protein
MRYTRIAAVAAWLCSPTGSSVVNAQVVDEKERAEVTLCNRSNDDISAVIIHSDFYGSKKLVLSGWYDVSRGQCRILDSFPRGPVYVYGQQTSGSRTWGGHAMYACLAKRALEQTVFPNEQCLRGEERRGFFSKGLASAKETIPLE